MFSDDVYRTRLSDTIAALETWSATLAGCATVATDVTAAYWKLTVTPSARGACPFDLMLRADQRFNLQIADEIYEDKPVDAFQFFPMLARAIAAGRVERITIASALTDAPEAIEMRVTLEDGWAWIGERRLASWGPRKNEAAHTQKIHRFLPYRRD